MRSQRAGARVGAAIGLAAIGLAALAAAPRRAAADPDFHGWRATGDLALDLRGTPGDAGAVEVGPGLRATVGPRWLGYAAGIDLRAGGGARGGLALDAALYPIGVSLLHGAPVSLRVVAGVGAGGVTGHLPFAARFPIEAEVELHPLGAVELTAWAECAWVPRHGRIAGAVDAPFGDELIVGATVRLGRHDRQARMTWSNGWRVGATLTERAGERTLGAVIGWGIDLAGGDVAGGGRDEVPE